MSKKHIVGRRQFILITAGVAAEGFGISCGGYATPDEIQDAARKVGWLPRRKLDHSGREVSVLVGAGTWCAPAVEAGIQCGVNYWHKSDKWDKASVPQAILKNRDAHYCEVCCDRVHGNHETGVIDEEAHYQYVKESLARTGLGYFDDMMFHFGYHTVAEIQNRGLIRAYDRLKKEGLVRHLCLSQHSYQGNSKVKDGEPNYEILTAVMNDGLFEHAQFFFTYGDNQGINDFVSKAKTKGFGTTAIKTTGGAGRMKDDREFMKSFPADTTPHQALARWLTTQTALSCAVIQINSLEQFVDTYSGAGKSLRAADSRAIEMMSAYTDREVCRLCNDCMTRCEKGLPIAEILRYERYARDYHEVERARGLYARLALDAGECSSCGACVPHCAQGLKIPEKLRQTHQLLS
jgi:predicted aldo/keto reductase-like oxidoreductase